MTPGEDMVERVALAMKDELHGQGVLYEDDEPADKLMMMTGESADLNAVARAVIAALSPYRSETSE